MTHLRRIGRGGRLFLALAVAGGTFAIVTAIQAAIPDATGVAHGCVISGNPATAKNYLRMIDTEHGFQCQPNEVPVNFASTNSGNAPGNDVYYGNGEVVNTVPAQTTIASVAVPAGNYEVSATGWAAGLTPGVKNARCYINTPTGDASDTFTSVGLDGTDIGGQTSWAVQKNVSLPGGGTIYARCLDSGAGSDVLYGAQLNAFRVLNLHGAVFGPAGQGSAKPTPTKPH